MAVINSLNPDFDFSKALRERILQEAQEWEIFGTSPLTSAASSPLSSLPSSPSSSPLSLPTSLNDEPPFLEPLPHPEPTSHPQLSTGLLQFPNDPPTSPPPSTVIPAPTKRDRKKKRKAAHTHARQKRRAEAAEASFGQHQVREQALKLYVRPAPVISTPMDTESLSVDSKGFIGIDNVRRSKKIFKLSELVGEGSKGFRLIHWDGKCVSAGYLLNYLLTSFSIEHPHRSLIRKIELLESWPALLRTTTGRRCIVMRRRHWRAFDINACLPRGRRNEKIVGDPFSPCSAVCRTAAVNDNRRIYTTYLPIKRSSRN